MKKYEILARFDASGQQVSFGFIEAETAVKAITIILTEKSDDLASATEITACNSDGSLSAAVYFDDGYEIHVYDNSGNDVIVIKTKIEDK